MTAIHVVAPDNSDWFEAIAAELEGDFDIHRHRDWESLPGDNADPKILLKPTSPVIALADKNHIQDLEAGLTSLTINGSPIDRRHPVLFITDDESVKALTPHIQTLDDYLDKNFGVDELKIKLKQIISRTESQKKLARDLNEASEIALLSMSHSSELGEISRFILKSYKCTTYDELFAALFETTETFFLECSGLIVVDDSVTVQSSTGIVSEELKNTLLRFHDTKRIVDLGNEMIISYEHGSIMVHNMPRHDLPRHGRLTDNMAVLGNCFEARVRGIEAEQKAEAASRAKTMFLATMSHELRTPMNSVIGYTGRLIKKLDGRISDKESRQLDAIRRNGDHLLKLINDILDMSKIEVGQMEIYPEPTDIAALLRNVYVQLQPIAANHDLQFYLHLEAEPFIAKVDTKRFTQIVMNLISNAIKYTQAGSVSIKLSQVQEVDIGAAAAIAVKDTGIGISKAGQEKLFGNFVQIDSALSRTVEGSGLGLAISAFFAKRHGGRIKLESEEGKGSCFTLLVPISESP